MTYGDSFLPDRLRGGLSRLRRRRATPALMTVFRNDGRWDTSNVIFDGRMVTLYDKQRRTRPAADFTFIDYGLSALSRRVIADEIPAGRQRRPGDAVSRAERARRRWRASRWRSASTRSARPPGLEDFERWLRPRGLIVLDRDGVLNALVRQPGRAAPGQPAAHGARWWCSRGCRACCAI